MRNPTLGVLHPACPLGQDRGDASLWTVERFARRLEKRLQAMQEVSPRPKGLMFMFYLDHLALGC